MIAEAWTLSGTEYVSRALVKFPLPALPAFATITAANLYYYYNPTTTHLQGNSYNAGSPYPLSNEGTIYRVNQNWNAFNVNWNNQPTYSMQNAVAVPFSTSQTQNLTINVTPLVNDMYLNPNTSFGFLFKLNTETKYRSQVYASSDNANPALHPRLVICYNLAPAGIVDLSNNNDFNIVYDNIGNLILSNKGAFQLKTMKMFNINGSLISENWVNNTLQKQMISLPSNIAKGIYFIQISTDKGILNRKIAIQ